MKHRKRHIKNKVHSLKKKKLILKRPIFWIIILFLIITFSLVYIFIFFSKFQVNSIIILGNNNVQSEVLQNIAWDNINKNISKSIFLAGPKTISEDILKKFNQIETVKSAKKFPQTIIVEIKERVIFAVFCQTDDKKCFYIDGNGIIFKALDQIPENITTIKQLTEYKEVYSGQKVIEKNIMDMISEIKKNLKDNFQVDINSVIISTPSRLDIKTSEGWQIYFNLDPEFDLQIAKMNALLKDEISIDVRKTLQYIDLRFKDRAYYK